MQRLYKFVTFAVHIATDSMLDKNTILGLVLIAVIVIVFGILQRPSKSEEESIKHYNDSVATEQLSRHRADSVAKLVADSAKTTLKDTVTVVVENDSIRVARSKATYGVFAAASKGEDQLVTLENDVMRLILSSHGGKIVSVELKKYKTYDSLPLKLFIADSTQFGIQLPTIENRVISSNDLFFVPSAEYVHCSGSGNVSLSMRMSLGPKKYFEYLYTLKGDSYMMGCNFSAVGMGDVIPDNIAHLDLSWKASLPRVEKNIVAERNASTMYYKYVDDEVDYLSEVKNDKKSLSTKVSWVAMKQQYFTSVLISDAGFEKGEVATLSDPTQMKVVKSMTASMSIPYHHQENETYAMRFYFGPNHYQTLKKFDLLLEKQIPLGWGIFGWVNKFIVIPVFNFLAGFNMNYGIIILLLTIFIKALLLPLTFKSFKSTAKMKVLKPEIDEINAQFGSDAVKKQQATMALYKKAGVNPLGGCFPMLLQMPILIALFRFFPASIELRQQSFLWANDLSTYDSIWDFGFRVPGYGDHMSLFTLLMTISTLIYTRMNSQLTGANTQMKWISYLMPIIFLGVFNDYSAGLSYYYFLANMFTFGQTYLFKYFIDEKKIHAQIQEHRKKPSSGKKSNFQKRLEDMAKQRSQKQLPKKK